MAHTIGGTDASSFQDHDDTTKTTTQPPPPPSKPNNRLLILQPLSILLHGAVLIVCHTSFSDANENRTAEDDVKSGNDDDGWDSFHERIRSGPEGWNVMDRVLFGVLILLAFELLNFLTKNVGHWVPGQKLIPVRGKHLDELSQKDLLFIGLNKAATSPFVYFFVRYMYAEPNAVWAMDRVSLMNVVFPMPVIFIVYDFFYTVLHWFLHVKAIYGYIHKHHHHQKAPSRANVDAVNVHPIEFFLGEYNHLFAIFLCCHVFNLQIHIVAAILFLAVGGAMAGLNHTRFDMKITFFGKLTLYDTKVHDVHHRIPQSNYGQYIMFWDYIFGSYRPYNENDRVNPKAQLDPKTGKSLEYMEAKRVAAKLE